MESNEPYFIESGGAFFLYSTDVRMPTTERKPSGLPPRLGAPKIIGQYSSEEELQRASLHLLGQKARRALNH